MPESPELIQGLHRLLAHDRRPGLREILGHLVEQVAMPRVTIGESAVHMPGDQFKEALHSGIEAVEI